MVLEKPDRSSPRASVAARRVAVRGLVEIWSGNLNLACL
jgi:hypothetical protein